MDRHFSVFYGKDTTSLICLIYMKHAAVCIKLCGVNTILESTNGTLCGGC